MKKILFVFAFVAFGLVANAQLFIAGSVSAYHLGGSTESFGVDYKPKENGFVITPAVGYMIPGKNYGGGLIFNYAYESAKEKISLTDAYNKIYSNTFDVTPFLRYAYAKFDKVTLYVDAKFPIGVSHEKQKYDNITVDLSKTSVLGARLIPGLTYKFNSHILFTTEIGLLSINYIHTKTKYPANIVDKNNEFKIGANTRQIASFGFVYLF